MAGMPATVDCPQHPGVETALRCSRCETPICPSCLTHTPVGARCRDCARVTRPPVYTHTGTHYLRAMAAAFFGGIGMGLVWALVLLPFTASYFSLLFGVGLGYLFTRLVELATGGKRGPLMAIFAIVGIRIAWLLMFIITALVRDSIYYALWGLLAAGIGVWFAWRNIAA